MSYGIWPVGQVQVKTQIPDTTHTHGARHIPVQQPTATPLGVTGGWGEGEGGLGATRNLVSRVAPTAWR
jgi:hypothetical protein